VIPGEALGVPVGLGDRASELIITDDALCVMLGRSLQPVTATTVVATTVAPWNLVGFLKACDVNGQHHQLARNGSCACAWVLIGQ